MVTLAVAHDPVSSPSRYASLFKVSLLIGSLPIGEDLRPGPIDPTDEEEETDGGQWSLD